MVKQRPKTVDDYIAAQPAAVQSTLQRVRTAIRNALPRAEEVVSYNMPAYKMDGEVVIYFAGWKKHFSIYPASDGVVATFSKEFAPYEINKGTIRFPLSEPVPVKLLQRIAKFRAAEVTKH